MTIPVIPMNEKSSYTEYEVTSPTTDFAIGFDYSEDINNIIVRIDDVPIEDTAYDATLINPLTVQITPAVPSGVVRISRETDIDENLHKFSGGALFTATTVDENFEQIRNSQQELRDEVIHIAHAEALQEQITANDAASIARDGVLQTNINNETSARSLADTYSLRVSDTPLNALPTAASRAGRFPAFDLFGQPVLSAGTGADAGLRTDLAATAGSSLVGFMQAGTGARFMSAQTKLRQRVNIKDYGAIGDGTVHYLSERYATLAAAQVDYPFATSLTTNSIDWAALQATINYCAGSTAAVYIPVGTFVLAAPRQGTQICMVNIMSNLTIIGEGYNSVLKIVDGYSALGDYRVMASSSGANVDYFRINGVRFDGNGLNNLVIDSGANVRRGYSINILAGINPEVYDCWFENNAGRNVLNFGNNANPPSIIKARIVGNRFSNVGGAIVGNQNQNDHSSIYLQGTLGLVALNHFHNDAVFDPLGSPAFACVALEIHGNTTDVINNIVNNYGTGGNLVASVHDSYDNRWLNNKFLNMVSNVLTLWTASNFRNQRLTIRGNLITCNNITFPCGTAIFQNTQTGATSRQIEDIVIEDNTICYLSEVSKPNTAAGIQLTAVDGGVIQRNKFYNVQGSAITLVEAIAVLDIYNVDIRDNEFDHCGIHTALTRLWGIYITNTDVNRLFSRINIHGNKFLKRYPTAIGATPFPTRGIRVVGGGLIQDVIIGGTNTFNNIDRTQRIDFVTTTNNKNVTVQQLLISATKATTPIRGLFDVNREMVQYNDYVAGGAVGRIVTTGGAGSEATWAATTGYTQGQWIKTSTGKVLVCLGAGTSSASEPAPTTLGITLTDGTVTWIYRDSASALFSEYGTSYLTGTASYTPAAIAVGAKFTVSVTVPATVLGDIATASYSAPLQGLSMSCSVDASNVANVTFANNTAASVTLAAGTIYVRAFKQ